MPRAHESLRHCGLQIRRCETGSDSPQRLATLVDHRRNAAAVLLRAFLATSGELKQLRHCVQRRQESARGLAQQGRRLVRIQRTRRSLAVDTMGVRAGAIPGTGAVPLGALVSIRHRRVLCSIFGCASGIVLSWRVASFRLRQTGPLVLLRIRQATARLISRRCGVAPRRACRRSRALPSAPAPP